MRIAICGGGLVGAYLYRLLQAAGYTHVSVFEQASPHVTHCGINPCAWGALTGFEEKINSAGLKADKYILRTYDHLVINEVAVGARVMLIDKPRLIADLLKGATLLRSAPVAADFDRMIDATGFARAYLPPVEDDLLASCVQHRIKGPDNCDSAIYVGNLGYAWRFPLSDSEYHIGAGSVAVAPGRLLEKLGWLTDYCQVCACASKIRLSGADSGRPFFSPAKGRPPSVWGVGEAIGCVSPLMGEGILPGLTSASVLLTNWEEPASYQKSILKEFSWMKDERQVLEKLVHHRPLGIFDGTTLRNSVSRLKMEFNYSQSFSLLNSINRTLTL